MNKRAAKPTKKTLHPRSTSVWEWIIAAFGVLLVLGTLLYLFHFEISTASRPPEVVLEQREISRSGNEFLVSFAARNRSSSAAAKLRIRGDLYREGRIVESNELVFDYLPGFSVRRGYFLFQQDPSTGDLRLAPLSYLDP